MRPTLFSAFASALLAVNLGSSAADVVTYDWRVTNITASYDGVSIQSLGINGKPSDQSVIDVELGQEVEVRVTNELNEPTCLHWHGLKQLGTQEMDGTSELTQCHIDPNGTAIYRFKPDKAGTFWWHSHHIAQYAYGLRGPLIVHASGSEQQEWENDIDGEFIVQMADLYHRPPQPVRMWDNILINNRGRYNCTAAAHHNLTECTDDQPLSHFRFKASNKYLLRLINMAALSPIQFSIDNHEFQVIAADGEPLQPSKPINSVVLNAAQRYDVLVQAKVSSGVGKQGQNQNGKHKEVGSFWMRATGLHGLPWTRGTPAVAGEGYNYEGLAIVSYESESDEEPTSQQPMNTTTVSEFDFTPIAPVVLPSAPSDRAVLQLKMQNGSGYFAIDGGDFNHFTLPDDPPLYSIAAGLKTEDLPVTTNARKINYGDHIEVVLVNVKDEQHPFHMHSHTPWVVGSGVASLDAIHNNTLPELRLISPMKRDVYTIPPCTSDGNGGCLDAGYVVLRFNADNPGVWIMHCHIDWHLLAGLSMVFVEGEEQLQQKGLSAFSNSMLSVCGSRHFGNSTSNSTMS